VMEDSAACMREAPANEAAIKGVSSFMRGIPYRRKLFPIARLLNTRALFFPFSS